MYEELKEIIKRLESLEEDSHPSIGLCEFDGYKDLVKRIETIENVLKKSS